MKINLRTIAPSRPLYLFLTLCVCLFFSAKISAQVQPPKVAYYKVDVNVANCPAGQGARQGSGSWEAYSHTLAGTNGLPANGSVTGTQLGTQFFYGNEPLKKVYLTIQMDFWGGHDANGAAYIDCIAT